jgi:hypothetical protein
MQINLYEIRGLLRILTFLVTVIIYTLSKYDFEGITLISNRNLSLLT